MSRISRTFISSGFLLGRINPESKETEFLVMQGNGTFQLVGMLGNGVDPNEMDMAYFKKMTEEELRNLLNPRFDFGACYDKQFKLRLRERLARARCDDERDHIKREHANARSAATLRFRRICADKKHLIEDAITRGQFGVYPRSFPKGRGQIGLATALKELKEEMHITEDQITIHHQRPLVIRYRDDGDIYEFHFFIATAKDGVEPDFDEKDDLQNLEVHSAGWFTQEAFASLDLDEVSRRVYAANWKVFEEQYLAVSGGQAPSSAAIAVPDAALTVYHRAHPDYEEPARPRAPPADASQRWQRPAPADASRQRWQPERRSAYVSRGTSDADTSTNWRRK